MSFRRVVVGALPIALGAFVVGALPLACFGKIAPTPDDGGNLDGSSSWETSDAPDGLASLNDGRGPAPVPSCVGQLSQCVDSDSGFVGAAIITCSGVYFVGPWNLLLERETSVGQFKVIEKRSILEPGFPTRFEDTSGQGRELTYRVCSVDELGTHCGTPFLTTGPPFCGCTPLTCQAANFCNTQYEDGCGTQASCGPCADGTQCNGFHSCCPPGMASDGFGGCECAPPRPCPRGYEWDVRLCMCANAH